MPPPFYYTIQSLRVDGDRSADPRDYADLAPESPVGLELIGFLIGHLDTAYRPGREREPMEFLTPGGVLLQYRPTRLDLERWAKVKEIRIGCSTLLADGAPIPRPTRGPPPRPPSPVERLLDQAILQSRQYLPSPGPVHPRPARPPLTAVERLLRRVQLRRAKEAPPARRRGS